MIQSKMYLPHDKLKKYIKVYWFLKGEEENDSFSYTHNLMPDGCTTVLLVIDGTFNLDDYYKEGRIKRGIYVIPPCKKNNCLKFSSNIHVIDIQFNPSIFYKLFKTPVSMLEDKVYTLKELSIDFDNTILEQIYNLKSYSMIINYLDLFLFDLFYKTNFHADALILNISQLYKNGNLSSFFRDQNLSIRQVERNVKSLTGLTPKEIQKVARFYQVLEHIKFSAHNVNFTKLSYENNFYDQSHFTRDFKSFTGVTPRKFLKKMNEYPQFKGLCNLTNEITL